MKFKYQAVSANGTTITDMIEAENEEMARGMLSGMDLIPLEVKVMRAGEGEGLQSFLDRFAKVTPQELILFTKQFRTMLRAGISIVNLLSILENQTENPRLKRVAAMMGQDIKEGLSMYDAFARHKDVFSHLYASMIRAGESSGSLPEVMDRLTYILDHEHKIKSDVKAALQYPKIVLIFLGIAFLVLLTFVIPKFVSIFKSAHLDLPLPTQICIIMYQGLANYWYIILGVIAGVIIFLRFYLKTENGKYVRDMIFMRVPIVGPLLIKAAMSRFASIFAILQHSGVAVLDSMHILSETIGNYAISREFNRIGGKLREGRGISEPLSTARYFTPMVINMVAIGEESGNLDEMLSEISSHYDIEVEYQMKRLAEMIGPLLTIGLAAVVGFFALAIFLPMWDLTKMVH